MKFEVRYWALFLFFRWLRVVYWWLHKNIQLMLEFLKGPFLVLHMSYYTFMIFLMMLLSVILISMLMVLLSTQAFTNCVRGYDRTRKRHYAYTKIYVHGWFLYLEVIWIYQYIFFCPVLGCLLLPSILSLTRCADFFVCLFSQKLKL